MKIGPKMATLQDENRKNPKNGPEHLKNVFFSQKTPIFELLKPVPQSPHQTNFFWPGHQFCPKVPSRAV